MCPDKCCIVCHGKVDLRVGSKLGNVWFGVLSSVDEESKRSRGVVNWQSWFQNILASFWYFLEASRHLFEKSVKTDTDFNSGCQELPDFPDHGHGNLTKRLLRLVRARREEPVRHDYIETLIPEGLG